MPSVQKKTGPVAGDVKGEDLDDDLDKDSELPLVKGKKPNKRKSVKVEEAEAPVEDKNPTANGNKASKKRKSAAKDELTETTSSSAEAGSGAKPGKKRKSEPATNKKDAVKSKKGGEKTDGRRRSARVSKNGI